MSLETLEQSDLTDQERDHLKASSALWQTMREGRHLNDWLALSLDLQNGSRLAMRYAGVNRREGKGYARAFGDFLGRWFPSLDKNSVSCLLWLTDDPERMAILNELRATTPGFNLKVTSPNTAMKKVKEVLNARGDAPSPKPRKSQRETIRELENVISDMSVQLETDSSLFDWGKTPTPQVARILYEGHSRRALQLAEEIQRHHKKMLEQAKAAKTRRATKAG